MNSQPDPMNGTPLQSPAVVPVVLPAARPFFWSLRREFWENRFIYIAPSAVAAVFLVGFLISTLHLTARIRHTSDLTPMQQADRIVHGYDIAALAIMAATFILAFFYCLDALYGERRDRSILFWKSMPVSDLTTVLAKASIPLLILPLLTFALTVATHCIMLVLSSAAWLGSGQSLATLWTELSLLSRWEGLLFHLVVVHGLWYGPLYGWMLLVSAWAQRAPFLWALLPPVVISALEKIIFDTSHFANLIASVIGAGDGGAVTGKASNSMAMIAHPGLAESLTSPGLWIGLAVTAAFLAIAVRLRRYRVPI